MFSLKLESNALIAGIDLSGTSVYDTGPYFLSIEFEASRSDENMKKDIVDTYSLPEPAYYSVAKVKEQKQPHCYSTHSYYDSRYLVFDSNHCKDVVKKFYSKELISSPEQDEINTIVEKFEHIRAIHKKISPNISIAQTEMLSDFFAQHVSSLFATFNSVIIALRLFYLIQCIQILTPDQTFWGHTLYTHEMLDTVKEKFPKDSKRIALYQHWSAMSRLYAGEEFIEKLLKSGGTLPALKVQQTIIDGLFWDAIKKEFGIEHEGLCSMLLLIIQAKLALHLTTFNRDKPEETLTLFKAKLTEQKINLQEVAWASSLTEAQIQTLGLEGRPQLDVEQISVGSPAPASDTPLINHSIFVAAASTLVTTPASISDGLQTPSSAKQQTQLTPEAPPRSTF